MPTNCKLALVLAYVYSSCEIVENLLIGKTNVTMLVFFFPLVILLVEVVEKKFGSL